MKKALATGSADAPGAATIVNAMATGRGAAFAIGLRVRATVSILEGGGVSGRIVGEPEESTRLMELCVERAIRAAGKSYGASIVTESNLPIARGLSSSSACSNACLLAADSALRKAGLGGLSEKALVSMGIDASIEAGVTVTGAFDDASASFHGGAVVTDNTTRKILRRSPVPDLETAILVPGRKSYSGKVDLDSIRLLAPQVAIAHREALAGDLLMAMTLNGLIYCSSLGYDPRAALLALRHGALAAGLSGKGPATVAVGENLDGVADAWGELGDAVIRTTTDNLGARVIE